MYPTYPPSQPILGMGSVSPNVNATAATFLWDSRAGYSLYRSAAATAPAPEIDYRRRGLMGSAIIQNPAAAAGGDVGGGGGGGGAEAGACLSQTLSGPTGGSTSLRLATTMSPLHQMPILVSRPIEFCMYSLLYLKTCITRVKNLAKTVAYVFCMAKVIAIRLLQLRCLMWVKA